MGEGTCGGERDFLFFSLLPNEFPWCSHGVPIKCPNMFLKMLPIAPLFHPIWFAQSCLVVNCIGGPKGITLHLDIETSMLGEFSKYYFSFFIFGNGPMKMTHCQKRKKKLGRYPHLNGFFLLMIWLWKHGWLGWIKFEIISSS
jgi:hypothetical protein